MLRETPWPGEDTLLHEVLQQPERQRTRARRFREIARVSGLIFQSHPNEKRSNKQLQASSSLFYEVFRKYDPANRLLMQAEQELLQDELDIGAWPKPGAHAYASNWCCARGAATPFAFPLMVERFARS
jgi:ATP-dependent Lhr-like helicase